MAETHIAPSEHTRTDIQIGLPVEDQRTGDARLVVYVDDRVVLTRDETGSTTLTPRPSFETELGTRYRARPGADPDVDGGQYERLRDRLAEYAARDGRKARHKADALREALDLLVGTAASNDEGDGPAETDDAAAATDGDGAPHDVSVVPTADAADATAGPDGDIAFEEIAGIGPETAGNLRRQGIVTAGDVRSVDDDVLRSVSGVGPDTVAKIREFVA